MTGNNKFWRASLAGLASVAMLATMGVTALTASAADTFKVKFGDVETVEVPKGESIVDSVKNGDGGYSNIPVPSKSGYTFVGWKDGDNFVDYTAVVSSNKTFTPAYVKDSESVDVTFNVPEGEVQFVGGDTKSSTKVAYNTGLNASQLPIDKAGDGRLINEWNVKITEDGNSTTKKNVKTADLTQTFITGRPSSSAKIEISPARHVKDVKTVTFAAKDDYYPLNNDADGAVEGGSYQVDVAKGSEVVAPAFLQKPNTNPTQLPAAWVNDEEGASVEPGAKYEVDDTVTLVPGEFSDFFTVTFKDDLDKSVLSSVKVVKGKAVAKPADPSHDGYKFAGWTKNDGTAFDFGNAITEDTTVWAKFALSGQIKVTFKDDSANPNPNKTVEVTANGNDYLTADQVPDFTRDGYLFAGWDNTATPKTESLSEDDLTRQLVKSFNDTHNVTFTARWQKATTDIAKAALGYLPATDDIFQNKYNEKGELVEKVVLDGAEFTSSSWDEYTKVYKQAVDDYRKAQYESVEVSAATSAAIVKNLNDAWKKLVFATDTETGFSGVKPAYRFYNRVTNEHLFTTNPTEVDILKGNPDWSYEGVAFSILDVNKDWANFDAAVKTAGFTDTEDQVVANNIKAQLAAAAQPITVEVYRLYNRVTNEHLFSTSAEEKDLLLAGDWSYESSFYAPAFSSTKNVYRLYNPILNQHLFTQNKAEVDQTTAGDWKLEGVVFKAL